MTWRYKKTEHYEKERLFAEWDHEILGLEQYEEKGVITGEDPF